MSYKVKASDLCVASYLGDSVDRFDGRTGAWIRSMHSSALGGPMDIAFQKPRLVPNPR